MNSPFEQCATLNVTGSRTGRWRSGQPNKANTPKFDNPFVLSQRSRAKLFMVVDPRGVAHHFAGMTPEEINGHLEHVIKVDVRVDQDGVAYVQETTYAREA